MRHLSRIVKWVMYQDRCKTDEAQGSGCCTWTIGTRLEEEESKEQTVEDGLMYEKRDASEYEARCLLDPEENEMRPTAAAKRTVIETERWKVEEAAHVAGIPVRIERGALVVTKYFQSVWGVWMEVDEKTEASHFRRGTWGTRSEGDCGGWSWAQVANGTKTGADIEMGNTGSVGAAARGAVKKAKLAK